MVIIGIIIFFLLRSTTAPVDPLVTARARALEAAQGLDILSVEYPQEAQGAEYSGIRAGFARARSAFDSAKIDLAKVDAQAVDQIAVAFTSLDEKITARAPTEEVLALADQAKAALLKLSKP